ncbi:hypothetical protein [Sphingobium sp. D43FB]|uniref:hypothetical protein n=1 Tax=Sphingobium sp. D43FB TaxID=2017595 RepID=UPI000BD2D00C|nr:hypothetical protein [Sphingobium sp. D43FB]PBN41309.1 hypothetical protein SxD43FB_22530 [Sphingobium sp. D43FB]
MYTRNFEIEQRYVGHVQDEPMIWQETSDDIDDIIAQTEDMVRRRIIENGAGEGIVIDTLTNRIVACFGMHIPIDEIEENRVIEVVKLWSNS